MKSISNHIHLTATYKLSQVTAICRNSHLGGSWPCVDGFFCNEVGTEDIEWRIVEEVVDGSEG